MTGESGPSTSENHENDPKRRTSRLESNALIQGLERLRECLEGRLKGLETVVRERAASASPSPVPERSELEQMLQQRIAEYEEAQLRLRAQAERREQEWQTSLEQLEGDRKLLAEAWERLEREQLESKAQAPVQGTGRASPAERGSSTPHRPHPELADPVSDQVAHAILKQFHALRNDVRRNARQRGSR